MHFKKLELVGFKSFADKTLIQFEPGVTAIVGPNGCGKSNVSDSIRWALGEQSAKSLRGGSMQDVIFNGTAVREPLNMAEVSLTLSNESKILAIDYDEVTITRRLFRSGESEYLINKNPVRLKDVNDLLMGTGIGTDHYSVIEQGKMDLILNSRPEDRRVIFEEAAGITKFKSKKQEALRKLEQTDTNLLRINDIVQEVKRQIGSIERQAKKAQAYRAEYEKLKTLELDVARKEFLIFDSQKKQKDDELGLLRQEEERLSAGVAALETECQAVRVRLDEVENALRQNQARQIGVSAQIRSGQDRLLLNRERLGELSERKNELLRQMESARQRVGEYAAEIEGLRAELELARRQEEEGRVFLETVEAQFGAIEEFIRTALAQRDGARQKLQELSSEKAQAQDQLAQVRAALSALMRRHEELSGQEAGQAGELGRVQTQLEQIQTGLSEAAGKMDAIALRKKSDEDLLSRQAEEIRRKEESVQSLFIEESSLGSKIDFLKDLQSRREGFLSGVKALLEAKAADPGPWGGMQGLLADQMNVEPGYELAAEAALESYLQAVVFGTDQELIRGVDFLRSAGKGRAILVSLDWQTGAPAETELDTQLPKVLSFVKVKPELEGLLGHLIGNVFLAEDAPGAARTVRSNPRMVCVTKHGERFEARAVMGGSLSASAEATLIGRDARIRELSQLRSLTAEHLAEEQRALDGLRGAQAHLADQIRVLADDLMKAQVEVTDKRSQRVYVEEQLQKERQRHAALLQDLELSNSKRQELERSADDCQQRCQYQLGEEKTAMDAILSSENAVTAKAAEKEELLVRLTQTRSLQSGFIAKREKIEKDCNWILDSKTNQEQLLASFETESRSADAKREGLELECGSLEVQVAEWTQNRDEALMQSEGLTRDRDEASGEVQQKESGRQSEFSRLAGVKDKMHAFEMEGAQIQFSIDRLKERIFNAYQIDLMVREAIAETEAAAAQESTTDAAGAQASEPADLETAHARIQAQRDRLNKMGPVNLAATEEYEELKIRFDFLTQQQQDLVKAKEDLHQAILKINRTTKELFVETFAKIQQYFHDYFRLLFNGGQAELVMMDEQNVLECGIEIVARPPGKKLQNITLLSGGEKALTAIALLFALFKVKPSPFCILDEIDAPLDETNVERFCRLLKDFIGQSQFILITHNKRTINLSDAMYGITMSQTGVSQIVSVRFAQKTADPAQDQKPEAVTA